MPSVTFNQGHVPTATMKSYYYLLGSALIFVSTNIRGYAVPSVIDFAPALDLIYLNENEAGLATVPVERSGETSSTASVAYTFYSSTGGVKKELDTPSSFGTITFSPGETVQRIQLTPIENGRLDGTRQIELRLSLPVNAVVGPKQVRQFEVGDNEVPFMVDPDFRPARNVISAFAVQRDGKILTAVPVPSPNPANSRIGGRLIRLNRDGTVDAGWNDQTEADGPINAVAQSRADDRILICGLFGRLKNFESAHVARLNPDGTVDLTFKCDGLEIEPKRIESMTDGKLLVLGYGILRLNADGSEDPTFNKWYSPCGKGLAMAVQPDGKILAGFRVECAIQHRGIVRLNADGTLDESFPASVGFGPRDPDTCCDAAVSMVLLRPNGQIVIGGNFDRVNDTERPVLALLNPDGSLDPRFQPPFATGSHHNTISSAIQPDGKVLASFYLGFPVTPLQRFNPDGALDPTFGSNVFGEVQVLPDGNLLVYERPDGRLLRLFGDPAPITGFGFTPDTVVGDDAVRVTVPKSEPTVTLEVFRYGETIESAAVEYETRDGTATGGVEYQAVRGTLNFAPLETRKFVTIPLRPDSAAGRAKTFTVALSNPSNRGLLATARTVLVTIGSHESLLLSRPDSVTNPLLNFSLVSTSPGRSYVLEASTNLGSAWHPLQVKIATHDALEFLVQEAVSSNQRFYRSRRVGP